MKNRAKCKLCGDIIESFHPLDYVSCGCGEISVDGGAAYKCSAKDWNNFLRIDDEGNEIIPIIKDESKPIDKWPEEHIPGIVYEKVTKQEALKMLDDFRENIEKLPSIAMSQPITHYDFVSLLLLISSVLRAED
jgi:hypothetical protein